jgi:lipopolysaccharide export LptBFGC system permease protein LptF
LAINVADDADGMEMGRSIMYIGALLASVFTMLVMGMCPDLEKHERLGLLVFLGIVLYAVTTGVGISFNF